MRLWHCSHMSAKLWQLAMATVPKYSWLPHNTYLSGHIPKYGLWGSMGSFQVGDWLCQDEFDKTSQTFMYVHLKETWSMIWDYLHMSKEAGNFIVLHVLCLNDSCSWSKWAQNKSYVISKCIIQLLDEVPQYECSLKCFLLYGMWLDARSTFTVVTNPPILFLHHHCIHDSEKCLHQQWPWKW